MAKSSDHDFWKRQFEIGGNLPGAWFESASDLLTAVDVLDRFKGDLLGDMLSDRDRDLKTTRLFERISVHKVSAMLLAMATECLLKALWLKHGGRLAEDGQYVGVLKKKQHNLRELAEAVHRKSHINFTKREKDLLGRASAWIMSGRYPIQTKYSLPPRQPWRGDPVEDLKVLTAKLQTALGIEMKFQSE